MSNKRKVVFWCAIAVMVIAACVVVIPLCIQAHNAQVYEDLPKPTASPAPSQTQPSPTIEPTPKPTAEPYVSPINFEELWAINEDVYAWIEIPGMDISYPVVQHPTDDEYYLHYTIDGKKGLPASIYTEPSVNSKDFTDFNTVIYGHHAGNGLMFSNLVQYRDRSVLEANRDIIIYTPEREFHYKIFAAVLFGNEYIPYFYPGDTESSRQAYLDALAGVRDLNSYYLDDVEVNPDSRIITLSTCTGVSSNRVTNRYLVAAVLQDEIPDVEDIGR